MFPGMRRFALSAVGRDRPGIVAAVTRALLVHRVNIEDSQMAVLGGHFSMMLVLAAPDDVDPEALREELGTAATEMGLASPNLEELDEEATASAEATHVVSVYGVDHPGIVHAVAAALADDGTSIVDLRTQLSGAPETPLYVLLIEVAGPPDENRLRELARDQGVELTVRPLERDAL